MSVVGGLCAAVLTLFMVANPLSPWSASSDGSQPAVAATISSPTEGQTAGAQQATPGDAHQLYLGAYSSEVSARLLWAGLQADPGTKLDGLDAQFERSGVGDSIRYHVFAGRYASQDDADQHCEQLNEQHIACVAMADGGA